MFQYEMLQFIFHSIPRSLSSRNQNADNSTDHSDLSETTSRIQQQMTSFFQRMGAETQNRVQKTQAQLKQFNEEVIEPKKKVLELRAKQFRQNERIQNAMAATSNNFFSIVGKIPQYQKLVNIIYPATVNCFEDDKYDNLGQKVVLTIDDGPCRGNLDANMMNEVLALLRKYDAKATFFLVTNFVEDKEDLVRMILEHGHEIGNHMCEDRPYNNLSESDFEAELMFADAVLSQFSEEPIRIFRPPMGKSSKAMRTVLDRLGYTSVFGDVYGNDAWCNNAERCAQIIVQNTRPGSIVACHMPERGFREWCLEEIELALKGLTARGCTIVSFSEMRRTCPPCGSVPQSNGPHENQGPTLPAADNLPDPLESPAEILPPEEIEPPAESLLPEEIEPPAEILPPVLKKTNSSNTDV